MLDSRPYGGVENAGPGSSPLARPADGSPQAGQRHPRPARQAEEGPQGRHGPDRGRAHGPARVCRDREGLRHAHGSPEVRSREGGALPQPVPHQPVEDGRRPLRAAARRARRALPQVGDRVPPVFVITGPSGAGKGTLIRELLERIPELELAVSATTRAIRPGEHDGVDYWFVTNDEFDERVAAGEFLEHVVYVSGRCYGTLLSEVSRIAAKGKVCVLELETDGARAVHEKVAGAVTIFISAPVDELERRLRTRATESDGEIDDRVRLARNQLAQAEDFDHVVVNDDVERAAAE